MAISTAREKICTHSAYTVVHARTKLMRDTRRVSIRVSSAADDRRLDTVLHTYRLCVEKSKRRIKEDLSRSCRSDARSNREFSIRCKWRTRSDIASVGAGRAMQISKSIVMVQHNDISTPSLKTEDQRNIAPRPSAARPTGSKCAQRQVRPAGMLVRSSQARRSRTILAVSRFASFFRISPQDPTHNGTTGEFLAALSVA